MASGCISLDLKLAKEYIIKEIRYFFLENLELSVHLRYFPTWQHSGIGLPTILNKNYY